MNRSAPPEEGAGRELEAREPRQKRKPNAARLIADFPELRNIARIVRVRYCLLAEQWQELRWNAETSRFFSEWRGL
jgi:hypothetical protein